MTYLKISSTSFHPYRLLSLTCCILISLQLQTQAQTATINGRLTNGKQPVALATVLLEGMHTLQTLSDTAGYFILKRVPAGTYTLQVRGVGVQTMTKKVVLHSGQQLKLQLTVHSL